jgi:hypothetical protein
MQKLLPIGYQKQNAQLVGIDPNHFYSPTLQILDSPDDCKHSHNIQTNFSLTFNLMALFPTLMGQTDL